MNFTPERPPTQASSERLELNQENLQDRYDRTVALVMRAGSWLSSPAAQLLSSADWETQFARYRELLELCRSLGDALRPVSLRPEPPVTDALTVDVMELFAAEKGGAL